MSYLPQQATADRLIAKFGAPCTLSTQAQTGYDGLGNPINTPSVSISGTGVKLNYGTQEKLQRSEVNGSVVQQGDIKFLLSTRALPQIDMRVTLAGEVWRVVAVDTLAPSSADVILYTLQLRK